ncbi:MAG TPA: CcoQ/FixQ family Cbb3-type cytochrome c oxidase assembly chaperone [Bacteroidia bacterium]|nr:CcoQ/FixQ family Cbb3-type cytochrome c oxidase assembly chaperone [Bacteroidia bacterium]
MFKNYLNGIDGIDTYPVLSLVAFFVFFMAMTIWLFRADKKQLEKLSQLPFNEKNKNN